MKNLTILLENHPGALAEMGETLGRAGVSLEGGGTFVVDNKGIANFLIEDAEAARCALAAVGITVLREDHVVLQKLNQDEPGQLGKLLRRMAQAGVNILTQYSDHNHQLVLVVDNLPAAQRVSELWTNERSTPPNPSPKTRTHHYTAHISWTGNKGSGTSSYTGYTRDHSISAPNKPTIPASSDPAFRGDPTRYNPEELLVAGASACHMLSYLHLCAVNGIIVLSYEDQPTGDMEEIIGGPGGFVRIDLHPTVTISPTSDANLAETLHEEAHKYCFIANSLKIPVITHPRTINDTDPANKVR